MSPRRCEKRANGDERLTMGGGSFRLPPLPLCASSDGNYKVIAMTGRNARRQAATEAWKRRKRHFLTLPKAGRWDGAEIAQPASSLFYLYKILSFHASRAQERQTAHALCVEARLEARWKLGSARRAYTTLAGPLL
jgi:hypothetical protein